MQFGKNLAKALAEKGLTQAALAVEAGVSQGAISRYLNGKASPKAEELQRIAAVLLVPMEWLLTGQGPSSFDDAIRAAAKARLAEILRADPELQKGSARDKEAAFWKHFDSEVLNEDSNLEEAKAKIRARALAEPDEDFTARLNALDRVATHYFHDATELSRLAIEAASGSSDQGLKAILRGMAKSMDEIRPLIQGELHALMVTCSALREAATLKRRSHK